MRAANALSGSSILRRPSATRLGSTDDQLVVESAANTNTLSGESAAICRQIITASDGTTKLESIPTDAEPATVVALAEELWSAGILYPETLFESLSFDDRYRSLFERTVLALPLDERQSFVDGLSETAVHVGGDTVLAEALLPKIDPVTWDAEIKTADIVVFVDPGSRADSERISRQWLDSDAVLIRLSLQGTALEVGPILTPASQSCLSCLTTRESINDMERQIEYESLDSSVTSERIILQQILARLVIQSAAELLPAPLIDRIITLDLRTLDRTQSRLFGVPGCDICNGKY